MRGTNCIKYENSGRLYYQLVSSTYFCIWQEVLIVLYMIYHFVFIVVLEKRRVKIVKKIKEQKMAVVSCCFKVKMGKQRLFRNRYDFGKSRNWDDNFFMVWGYLFYQIVHVGTLNGWRLSLSFGDIPFLISSCGDFEWSHLAFRYASTWQRW